MPTEGGARPARGPRPAFSVRAMTSHTSSFFCYKTVLEGGQFRQYRQGKENKSCRHSDALQSRPAVASSRMGGHARTQAGIGGFMGALPPVTPSSAAGSGHARCPALHLG